MGFGGLFGGGDTTVPATGFYALPEEYQDLYTGLLGQAANVLLPNGQLNTDMFTPLAKTADEQRAFEMAREGLAPTEESLREGVSMLMNPFDDYVTDGMNREAQGQYSILNQAMNSTGQFGSNRSILGANDIEQTRLNNIGQFRQGQYNNAVDSVLGRITDLKGQDITNLMNLGSFDRGLDTQTKQAPYTALNAGLGAMNQFRTEFGNFGTEEQTIDGGGGFGGILGTIGSIAGNAILPGIGGAIGGAAGGFLGGGDISSALSGGLRGFGGLGGSTALSSTMSPDLFRTPPFNPSSSFFG